MATCITRHNVSTIGISKKKNRNYYENHIPDFRCLKVIFQQDKNMQTLELRNAGTLVIE